MKHQALAFLLILSALLAVLFCGGTGCAGTERIDPLFFTSGTFSAQVHGSFPDQAVAFSLLHAADGSFTLTYTAPAACQGLTYRQYADDRTPVATLGEITLPMAQNALPPAVQAVFALFALQHADLRECNVSENGDTRAVFACAFGTVTLCLAKENGLPKEAVGELYGIAFSLTFTDCAKGGAA